MFASLENASALIIAVVLVAVACLVVFAWRRTRPVNKNAGEAVLSRPAGEPRTAGAAGGAAEWAPPGEIHKTAEDETSSVEVASEPKPANSDSPAIVMAVSDIAVFPPTGSGEEVGPVMESLSAASLETSGANTEIAVVNPSPAFEDEEPSKTETEDHGGKNEVPAEPQDESKTAWPNEPSAQHLDGEPSAELTAAFEAQIELPASNAANEAGEDSFEPVEEGNGVPARYRAPRLGPGKARKKKTAESSGGDAGKEQALELRVRCIIGSHAFCRFHLLAEREACAPAELEGRNGRHATRLIEAGDDWYEVEESGDLPALLEHGTTIKVTEGKDAGETWELRGRDLYILASLRGILGFVSTTRLSLGRKQIVLCREKHASAVEAILVEAGCSGIEASGRERGAPAGWVFFGPITPSRSVPQVAGDGLLNLVRPIPDIEILLEGGLWLHGSAWMAGYPPSVHITGQMPACVSVTIDGEVAEEGDEKSYRTPNSANQGTHTVWCAGKTASYSISEPEEGWEQWEAYPDTRGGICGATTTRSEKNGTQETLITVPTTNPILIGAIPGQIFRCDARPGRQWSGFVPFAACWALPADPLQCDRSVRRVLLIRQVSPAQGRLGRPSKNSIRRNILQWSYAIRDCQRKRLPVSPDNAVSEGLWREYTAAARATWRAAR